MTRTKRNLMKRTITSTLFASLVALTVMGQSASDLSFKHLTQHMPAEWFATADALSAADSVLKYQFPSGGWAKNHSWHQSVQGSKARERQEVWQQIHSKSGVGSTIDNGATTTEMTFLAKMYSQTGTEKYRKAFIRGLQYLLEAQYDNGGWPQYYPLKPQNSEGHPFYSDHITFNDNAILNVMKLLQGVSEGKAPFDKLRINDKMKLQSGQAFDRGIECILNCQIVKDSVLTVWCQQHDEKTLEPANARAYELASFTGSHETAGLLLLLMSLPEPSPKVITAVTAAARWLEAHALRDVALEHFTNAEGKPDRRLVHRFGSRLWARYYDLVTEEPYVCDRDGKPQPSLEYIGYERRNGYGWYGDEPEKVLQRLPKWIAKHGRK